MARHAGISLVHLRRLCMARWGEPLMSWLHDRRMVAAGYLLREDFKVREIAQRVGYRQVTHFSRHFRRTFGVGPRQYQRDFRNQEAVALRSRA